MPKSFKDDLYSRLVNIGMVTWGHFTIKRSGCFCGKTFKYEITWDGKQENFDNWHEAYNFMLEQK